MSTVTLAHGGSEQHAQRPCSWEPSEELRVPSSEAASSVTSMDEAADLPDPQQQAASLPASGECSKPLLQHVPSVQTTFPQQGADAVGSRRPVPIRAMQSKLVR